MSGGLDSTLAAKLVLDQGVEVIGLHLASPFGCLNDVNQSAETLGIPLLIKEKGEAYLDLVKNPKFGYGKAMNPCIDCRIFMFELAEVVRQEENADFIVTGEVLGQRPMSQVRRSITVIDEESDMGNRVVRPLSGKMMAPTLAETEGWLDREKLLAIHGRGRKQQIALAKQMGIAIYESPGGGCLLTETSFASRLKDFFAHDENLSPKTRLAQSALVRLGRHFRLSASQKLIVGRNQEENREMETLWQNSQGWLLKPSGFSGPASIGVGPLTPKAVETAGQIMLRYGKPTGTPKVLVSHGTETKEYLVHTPIDEKTLETLRI